MTDEPNPEFNDGDSLDTDDDNMKEEDLPKPEFFKDEEDTEEDIDSEEEPSVEDVPPVDIDGDKIKEFASFEDTRPPKPEPIIKPEEAIPAKPKSPLYKESILTAYVNDMIVTWTEVGFDLGDVLIGMKRVIKDYEEKRRTII